MATSGGDQTGLLERGGGLRRGAFGHIEGAGDLGAGEGAEPGEQQPGVAGARGAVDVRETRLAQVDRRAGTDDVGAPGGGGGMEGVGEDRGDRPLAHRLERLARDEASECERRRTERKELRAHRHGQRCGPGSGAKGRATEGAPGGEVGFRAALEEADLLLAQSADEINQYGKRILGRQQRIEPLERVSADRIGCISKLSRNIKILSRMGGK